MAVDVGSGKTTLLNHILTARHGQRIAVIENEFGDVGIDDKLLEENMKKRVDGEELIEMMNGCICCTVRADLAVVLKKLKERHATKKLDAILIETTGMADPAPVAQTFFVDDEIKTFAKLDGIVTLVDAPRSVRRATRVESGAFFREGPSRDLYRRRRQAKHIVQHLDEEKPEGAENESVEQVAFADRLVLNKIDLVPEEADLKAVEARLRAINKFAPIVRCERSAVSPDSVLGIGAFDLKRTLEMDPEFLDTEGEHVHDSSVASSGIDLDAASGCEVDLGLYNKWLDDLMRDQGKDLFRMKGVLAVKNKPCRYAFHAGHMIYSGHFIEPWAPNEARSTKLTLIGKNLDHAALKAGFLACLATPENYAAYEAKLRFKVGDEVMANRRGDWCRGTIVARPYREPEFGPEFLAPYQIELHDRDRTLIYTPVDDDECIKEAIDYEAQIKKLNGLQGSKGCL